MQDAAWMSKGRPRGCASAPQQRAEPKIWIFCTWDWRKPGNDPPPHQLTSLDLSAGDAQTLFSERTGPRAPRSASSASSRRWHLGKGVAQVLPKTGGSGGQVYRAGTSVISYVTPAAFTEKYGRDEAHRGLVPVFIERIDH